MSFQPQIPGLRPGQTFQIENYAELIRLLSFIRNQGRIVSELPANPVDGEIVAYQNAGMGENGIVWMLRFHAASPNVSKWEFVGGTQISAFKAGPVKVTLQKENFTQQPVTETPKLVAPLRGVYYSTMWIEYCQLTLPVNGTPQINIGVGRTIIEGPFCVFIAPKAAEQNQFYTETLSAERALSIEAGESVEFWCGGNNTTANLFQIGSMELSLIPVRVG